MGGISKVHMANRVDNTSLVIGLITDGAMLKFGTGGKFLGETTALYNASGLSQIDVISILKQGNTIEVSFHIDGIFTKHPTNRTLIDIITDFNKIRGIIFAGKRDGDIEGISYSQYIYGFTQGILFTQNLMGVL